MAVRVRKTGEVVCAAMFPEEEGDTYLDDGVHYCLAVQLRAMAPLPHGRWKFIEQGTRDFDADPLVEHTLAPSV